MATYFGAAFMPSATLKSSRALVHGVLLRLTRVVRTLGQDSVSQVRFMTDTTVGPDGLMEVDQLFIFYERAFHA